MLIFAEADNFLGRNKAKKNTHENLMLEAVWTPIPKNKPATTTTTHVQADHPNPHHTPYLAPQSHPTTTTTTTTYNDPNILSPTLPTNTMTSPACHSHVTSITVLGEARTGKTSLVSRLTSGHFSKAYIPTYGADTTILCWGNKNTQLSYFRFLDTNDVILDPKMAVTFEDRAEALHARFSDCVIIVYDITDHTSFAAAKDWMRLAKDFLQTKCARLILVGNKTDLARKRQVHKTAGETLAALKGADFVETSALSEHNVHLLFLSMGGIR